MTRNIVRKAALLGALALGALATPDHAHAFQGFSAFACHVAQHDWPQVIASNGNGLENRSANPGARNMIVSCPLPNMMTTFTRVTITGFDGNNEANATLGQFQIRGCAKSVDGMGSGCTNPVTVSGLSATHTGLGRFSISSTVLNRLNSIGEGFRYLDVSIPRPGVSGSSRLIGYEVGP